MRQRWSERVKSAIRPTVMRALKPGAERYRCPVCGYLGPFKAKRLSRKPAVVRLHSKCPRCTAVERHRLQSLTLDRVLESWAPAGKSLLHVAPEDCLRDRLRGAFAVYNTMDLFRDDVDFREDLQRMSFADASYDVVFVSRVLTIPPDLGACLDEIRRVLKPGGVAMLSEFIDREKTEPDPRPETEAARFLGMEFFDDLRARFGRVELLRSADFPAEYQTESVIMRDGAPMDSAPDFVRAPGRGVQGVVALCYVDAGPTAASSS